MKTKLPAVLSIAIILLILTSFLFWVAVFLPVNGSNPGSPVVYGSVVLGVLGLVAAFGIFYLKRWGMGLSIGVSVFSAFFGAGGIVYSSDAITKGLGMLLVALYALVIVLVGIPHTPNSIPYKQQRPSRVQHTQASYLGSESEESHG